MVQRPVVAIHRRERSGLQLPPVAVADVAAELPGSSRVLPPVLRIVAQVGGGAAFNLSYNSQNWRQDPGGTWQLGRDVGYGYGWKLQAGSLTPVYRDYWTLDHYLFIDSTGAEYILNVNTAGVWSS